MDELERYLAEGCDVQMILPSGRKFLAKSTSKLYRLRILYLAEILYNLGS